MVKKERISKWKRKKKMNETKTRRRAELCKFTRERCGALGNRFPAVFFVSHSYVLRKYTHVSAGELSLRFSFHSFFCGWWICLQFWTEFVIHIWDTLESLIQSLPVLTCLYGFEFSCLRKLAKCLYALLPKVLIQRRKFLAAWFGWFLLKTLATKPEFPRWLPKRSFIYLRCCYRMDCLEAYRAWKRQKSFLKPMKRRATSDSKGSKRLPDPWLDPDFDPKDALGLNWWRKCLIFRQPNQSDGKMCFCSFSLDIAFFSMRRKIASTLFFCARSM